MSNTFCSVPNESAAQGRVGGCPIGLVNFAAPCYGCPKAHMTGGSHYQPCKGDVRIRRGPNPKKEVPGSSDSFGRSGSRFLKMDSESFHDHVNIRSKFMKMPNSA